MNRPREDGKLFFFSLDYFYECWPDGPLGARHICRLWLPLSEFPFALDFHGNDRTGDIYFHTNSFAQKTRFATGAKVNLGLGYSSMSCSGSLWFFPVSASNKLANQNDKLWLCCVFLISNILGVIFEAQVPHITFRKPFSFKQCYCSWVVIWTDFRFNCLQWRAWRLLQMIRYMRFSSTLSFLRNTDFVSFFPVV